jgi:hypothetical protein
MINFLIKEYKKEIEKKLNCDCCNKLFKRLWKDYRTDDNDITSKYYICGNCKNLNDVAFFMQMYKGKGVKE